MGYTHYWERPLELEKERFSLLSNEVKKLFEASKELGIKLSDGLDKKPEPFVDEEDIWFNGRGDESHESFHLPRIFTPQEWMKPSKAELYFSFCKTARKPYDLTVMAVLIAFKYHFEGVTVTSDGKEDNWAPAKEMCNQLFGYRLDFKLSKEITLDPVETYGLKIIRTDDLPTKEELNNV